MQIVRTGGVVGWIRSLARLVRAAARVPSPQRKMLLRAEPGYWRIADLWRRAGSQVAGVALRIRYRGRDARTTIGTFTGLLRSTIPFALAAIAVVATCEVVATLYHDRLRGFGYQLLEVLTVGVALQPSDYENLVVVAASVAGVLLALYFATIGVIAATAYADAPETVRTLFVNDRRSRVFTRTLAILLVTCVAVLLMRTISYVPHRPTLYLIVGLAVFTVLSLIVLGENLFRFFDPVQLSRELPREFLKWQRLTETGNPQSRVPWIQEVCYRQADYVLTCLQQLTMLATSGRHKSRTESLRDLAVRIDRLWSAYAHRRIRIPRDSMWFERVPQHADWLQPNFLDTSVALATSTDIQAKLVPDRMWIERRLLHMLEELFHAVAKDGDPRQAYEIAARIRIKCTQLVYTGFFAEALLAFDSLIRLADTAEELWSSEAESPPPEPLQEPSRSATIMLAVVEERAVALISMLLGLAEWATETLDEARFPSAVDRALKAANGTGLDYPTDQMLDALEWLNDAVHFERLAEGRRITPNWYATQILGRCALLSLTDALTTMSRCATDLVAYAERLSEQDRRVLAASVTRSGLELCEKLTFHLPRLAAAFGHTTATYRRDDDAQWPADPTETSLQVAVKLKSRLLTLVPVLAEKLASRPRHPRLPDHFGRLYATLVDETLQALLNGKGDAYARLFPTVAKVAVAAFERLRRTLTSGDPRIAVARMTEPLVDLLELSGAALLFSELHGSDAMSLTRQVWDDFFAGQQDPQRAGELFAMSLEIRQPLNLINPGMMARANRWRLVEQQLRTEGVATGHREWHPNTGRSGHPDYASDIVRVMARGGGHYHLYDLFAVVYLAERFPSIALPEPVRRLSDALARESERPQRSKVREQRHGSAPSEHEADAAQLHAKERSGDGRSK